MGAANMNHVEAGKVVVEFRKVICAAVAKAGPPMWMTSHRSPP